MRGLTSSGYGIDLGTANTVVCHPRRGVLLDEPSVMVVPADGESGQPILVGAAARDLWGRTPPGMIAIRPLRDGAITDLETARTFIVAILRMLRPRLWERIRPRAVVGVPAGATRLERQALAEAAEEAGVARPTLIPEPLAGALGCGLDPLEARTQMVVDVGGGTAEVTGFSYGRVVTTRSCRVAGDEMTLALQHYLRREHHLAISELAADDLKVRAGAVGSASLVVEGRDAGSGRARLVTLPADEVSEAIQPVGRNVVQTLAACLEELPPEAASDILRDGVLAFGGGCLGRGFQGLLEDSFGFSVRIAERPLTCVAEGAARCLERPDVLRAFAPP